MIVEFSVENFRSIKGLQTISFVATGLKSPEDFSNVDQNNIETDGDYRLLKTIGIYGANASGKSNVIRALDYFIHAIRNEPSPESNLKQLCDPFLYQSSANTHESYFQIVLLLNGRKFRYGFTVKINEAVIPNDEPKSKEVIVAEWLSGVVGKKTTDLFIRNRINVDKARLNSGQNIPTLPYEHTLFLTHAAAFDSEGFCANIRNFFKNWTISNFTEGLTRFRQNSLVLLATPKGKQDVLDLMASFNLKFNDIIIQRPTKSEPAIVGHDKIFLLKSYKNENDETFQIKLNLHDHESAGTQKLFDIAGLLLRAFNLTTSPLIILDEVDSNFHPSLLIRLIGLFNNPQINKSKAQLLFTSHDTNLMSPKIMRRDQFYFTEKKDDNSTRLYSLADLRGIRNDADFAKQYLAGFYGGLPVLESYMSPNPDNNDGTLEN